MFRLPKEEEHRQQWIFFYVRQARGRNFFISVRQLMPAEKKEY